MTQEQKDRIKADGVKAVKFKDWGEALQIEMYIAGATAEHERAQELVDALKSLLDQLPTGNTLNFYFAKQQVINAQQALQKWEGKEVEVELSCIVCGTKFMGPQPKTCCNGIDCSCMGMPVEPIVCSKECYENLPGKRSSSQHKSK